MATALELRSDQGAVVSVSYQDLPEEFFIEHQPGAPLKRVSFEEVRIGDRISTTPKHFKELVNVRMT